MSTITKERLTELSRRENVGAILGEEIAELARIALASLEAEPVCVIDQSNLDYLKSGSDADVWPASRTEMGDVLLYRAAPPAPVSVPDEDLLHMAASAIEDLLSNKDRYCAGVWADIPAKLRRAAMLQGADTELQRKAAIHDALCEKYNVESLADFVDWQRNHIAELEAAPPAPVGEGETAVMPDYPGYTMTQRECYQAGKKAGLAEAGNSPVIPDGYAVVPIEPTEDMIVYGFESEPDEDFSDPAVWEEYQAMSGCRQAAHRARLCWAAMIAAAPKQGDE